MTRELFINQTFKECRAALVDNGEILDFLIERGVDKSEQYPSVGDIYQAKVIRVLPGMQSAFVDIGYTKAAFLYVDDAYIPTLEEQKKIAERTRKEQEMMEGRSGDIIPDELSTLSDHVNMRFRPEVDIEDFLKEGDEILVQVSKEPISTKGPRVTRHITMAGRYIVFIPFVEHFGVSRRIESEEERERLKKNLDTIKPQGSGIIARTAAEGQNYKTLYADYTMLTKLWKDVLQRAKKTRAPELCYKDLNFVQRVLRDIADENTQRITVDSQEHLKNMKRFINKFIPPLKGKLHIYEGEIPLFEKFDLDMEIERGLSNKVFLRSGGSLNIDQTEALVSIDVNTGKFVGRKTLEETILRTNLEAVKEIAYQLRLRNCGGIIVIDFIDMETEEHRNQVYNAFVEVLKKDRAKTSVLPISGFGLVEMTRKRIRDTLIRVMSEPCPYCEGSGTVKSTLTVCYELVRQLIKVLKRHPHGKKIHIYTHPEVTAQLTESGLDMIEMIEKQYGQSVMIRSEENYHIEQYEIFSDDQTS